MPGITLLALAGVVDGCLAECFLDFSTGISFAGVDVLAEGAGMAMPGMLE